MSGHYSERGWVPGTPNETLDFPDEPLIPLTPDDQRAIVRGEVVTLLTAYLLSNNAPVNVDVATGTITTVYGEHRFDITVRPSKNRRRIYP